MNRERVRDTVLAQADNLQAASTTPPAEEIRRQLARIVASGGFRGALRLTRFITFVVEATLAGNADRIKAYTIALEALGRGGGFDPQSDPIVRVEAGRLRQALARYYAGAGRNDPLAIELPRGAYVPSFHWRSFDGFKPTAAASQHETLRESHCEPDRSAELAGRSRKLEHSLTEFQKLVEMQRTQLASLLDLIKAG
jgi:hypothetical protein